MSAEALAWAKHQEVGNGTRKLVLIELADSATPNGWTDPSIGQLAEVAEVGPRQVRAHVKALEAAELIARQPYYDPETGAQTANRVRVLVPPGADTRPLRADERPAPTSTSNGRSSARSLPPWPLSVEIPDEMAHDAQVFLDQRRKVDGKLVTPEEMLKAAAAMAEFNRRAEADQGLASALTMIVGRLRDRPSWDAETVVRLVQSAFIVRWWERDRSRASRRLTPAPIFGHARCFEMVIQDAQDLANGRGEQVEERRGKYDRNVVRDA